MDQEKLGGLSQESEEDAVEEYELDADVIEADAEPEGQLAAPVGKLKRALHFLRHYRAEIAVWARYALPLFTVAVLFVMGWFYNVRSVSVGVRYHVSLWRLYGSTLSGTHTYLGGKTVMAKSWFYGLISVGAIVGILCFLLAAFFAVLAFYTAYQSFRAGKDTERANRMKLIFKIAFPNRFCLLLSNALLLVPAFFPHFVSFVGSRFLVVSGEKTMFVLSNPVLATVGALLAVTLVLSLVIPKYERRKKMNMFLLEHPAEQDDE